MADLIALQARLSELERELAGLDERRNVLLCEIKTLREEVIRLERRSTPPQPNDSPPASTLSADDRVRLFRELFRGREDVFPRRFESAKTGRSGYQPACANEWRPGICRKPQVKCMACKHQAFIPPNDEIIRSHLLGHDPHDPKKRDFTIGVYPLLEDETCWFLAVDFDKTTWKDDAVAYWESCRSRAVPAAMERSRSGNGCHIWIFFAVAIPAMLARKLGSYLLTETMERRPELGFDSYDRFFPNQDTMPKGGFGNLIALPLQKRPREKGNSVFVNLMNLEPWPRQWDFLQSLPRMNREAVESIVDQAEREGRITGVRRVVIEDDAERDAPWTITPSRNFPRDELPGPLPERLRIVFGNQLYFAKAELTPPLHNRLIRLAAFQNPEFYKAQAMRFPTYNKPQIISCAEIFPNHIALPRGCLDEALNLLKNNNIEPELINERNAGEPINVSFQGQLRPDQYAAAKALLDSDTGGSAPRPPSVRR